MLTDLRIALIGAGAMGEAMISGLLRHELVRPDQIIATTPREERRRELQARYSITVSDDNLAAAHWGQVVVFAVKPQTLPRVLAPLRGTMRDNDLCISIVAGTLIRSLSESLEHAAIVRAMPNTPAQIGEGMTVWTAGVEVIEQQRGWARTVMGCLGHEVYVDDERYLDMATAINGTGPAYFFLVMEAMIDAGVHLGLSRRIEEPPIAGEVTRGIR